jgi:uncharacterized protein (TIGR00251 family)
MAAVASSDDRCVNSAQLTFLLNIPKCARKRHKCFGAARFEVHAKAAQVLRNVELFLEPMQVESMKLNVRVIPNAKAFRIEQSETGYRVYVKEKAEGNKANLALLKELKKLLKKEVGLVSGAKARNKVLEVEGTEKEVLGALRKKGAGKGA